METFIIFKFTQLQKEPRLLEPQLQSIMISKLASRFGPKEIVIMSIVFDYLFTLVSFLLLCHRRWVPLIDGLQLLKLSPSFSHQNQLESWFSEYSEWLTDSKFGHGESHATNNHGTWYVL